MTDVRATLPARVKPHTLWYGTIANDATDFTDLVDVVLPDFDEKLQWRDCFWQSRDATTLPQRGDKCLVMFDNRNQPWVVAWWPF
jgi:hypothetical protein